MIDCPKHEGSYDCSPFCEVCGGEQEISSKEYEKAISDVLDILAEMSEAGDYNQETLDEIEWRLS
jgi:hypothetical protein